MPISTRLIAGAMSGTSADGVDIALVEITGHGLEMTAKLLHHHARPYEAPLRHRIFAIRGGGNVELSELGKIGREISLAYASAVNDALQEANLKASDLAAIAAHGQTLFHEPPNTIQWFDPALVAAEVGCRVISDFRRADCAAGGQGAPLVPFADYILFRHPTKNRVLLNIGGIANLTYLPAGASIEQVIAFDTGPGNCISDHICRTYFAGGPGYDVGGAIASKKKPMKRLVAMFLQSPFFVAPPPKSTDGPTMVRLFDNVLERSTRESGPNVDCESMLASAAVITGCGIIGAIQLLPAKVDQVIVSGGGVHNMAIRRPMDLVLSQMQCEIFTADVVGIPSAAKEALAFALLGAATLDGYPANVPSATGARRSVVLGSITPSPFLCTGNL